jgi:hypothetical protein
VNIAVALDLRPGEEVLFNRAGQRIVGRVGATRCDRSEIDDLGLLFSRRQNQRKADASKTAVPGLDGGKRKAGRHGGVGRIAAGFKNGRTGHGGITALRNHDAMLALSMRFGDEPVLGLIGRSFDAQWRAPRREGFGQMRGGHTATGYVCIARICLRAVGARRRSFAIRIP